MLFWDGAQYRPISEDEAKHRIAEGQVPKVNADIPPGDDCPMCTGEILHIHTDEPSIHQQPPADPDPLEPRELAQDEKLAEAADVVAELAAAGQPSEPVDAREVAPTELEE